MCWLKEKGKKIGYKRAIFNLLLVEAGILILLGCCTYTRLDSMATKSMKYAQALKDSSGLRSTNLAVMMQELQTEYAADSVRRFAKEVGDWVVKIDSEYNRRLDYTLSDLRQETNNQLSSLNTWLTLWLGALSFMGVVLPLLITYMVRFDHREQQKQFENQYKVDYANAKEEIKAIYNETEQLKFNFSTHAANIELKIMDDLKGEEELFLKKLNNNYQKMHIFNEISAVINCATTLKELSRHYFTPEQKEHWIILFRLLLEKNSVYIHTFDCDSFSSSNDSQNEKYLNYFLVYLLQIQVLFKTLEPFYLDMNAHCVLSKARSWGKKTSRQIPHLSPEDVKARLEELQSILRNLIEVTREELDRG